MFYDTLFLHHVYVKREKMEEEGEQKRRKWDQELEEEGNYEEKERKRK
jgi:hypothetical protein